MKISANISKFSLGLFIGILGTSCIFSSIAVGGLPIKLVINNKEIVCDSVPQLINGSVMVPARNIAENLGAKVEWDAIKNTIRISSSAEDTSIKRSTMPDTTLIADEAKAQDLIKSSIGWDGIPRTTVNGMEAMTYHQEIYVNLQDAVKFYKLNGIIWDKNSDTLNFPLYQKSFKVNDLSDADLFVYQGKTFIQDRIVRNMIYTKQTDDYDDFKEMFRVKEIGKPDPDFKIVEIELVYSGIKNKNDFLNEWLSMSQDTKDNYGQRYAQDLSSHRNDCIVTFLYNDETVLGEIKVYNKIPSGSLIPNPND